MIEPTHLQRVRQEMPATTTKIFLNTGTFGPLPTCVVTAMQERLQYEWQYGRLGLASFEIMKSIYNTARQSAARLINANVEEIALTGNTSEGLNIISYGFNWQEGDEVITSNHEHYGVYAPLYQIRNRYGIVIRIADIGANAELPCLPAISNLITPRTRLIVLSHVTWTTGALLEINEIGRVGRELGIPVLIDGAQSIGAIPVDVKALDVDFYAMPMQKWLCGPDGTGLLYARQEAIHNVTSTYVGYPSGKHDDDVDWALHEHAQRFELGNRQTSAVAGQGVVLNWLEKEVGYKWLFERIAALNTYTYHALESVPNITLLTPKAGESGLIALKLEKHDPVEVVKYLREEHNISIRDIPSMKSIRISTGFYNTEEEIDTLVKALQKLRA